jgi:aminoglycoside phosphotransferase (APT) family kinase protein
MKLELGRRVGIGRGAEVFACGDGLVLKLLRDAGNADWLSREMRAQKAAMEAGVRVPRVLEIVEHEGRPGLLMEEIDGRDGLTAIEKQPWKIWQTSASLGRLHRAIAHVEAPPQLLDIKTIAAHDISTSERIPAAARPRLLALLAAAPEGHNLCHMDFHLGNVIVDATGPVVIDFASARGGDPVADHVKSLLLFEAGTPPEASAWIRVLVLLGRRLARAAYVRGYGKLTPEERMRAKVWWPILVGQRLAEGIPEERKTLLKLLGRTLREAESLSARRPGA